MKSFFSLLGCALLMLLTLGGAGAREVGPGLEKQIHGVVRQQLEDFRKNDFAAAYGFAHSGVREQFTQLEFEKMVRGGFPAMVKPGAVQFGETLQDEEIVAVQVILTDGDGKVTAYQYLFEKEKGAWRIVAVVPIEIEVQDKLV